MSETVRKLKIIGNYGVRGTQVIDEESGQKISNVRKVTWIHEVGKAPICTVELVGVGCEAVGNELVDVTPLDSPSPYRQFMTADELRKRDGLTPNV